MIIFEKNNLSYLCILIYVNYLHNRYVYFIITYILNIFIQYK